MSEDPRYASLRAVLERAYAHAAVGKGKERHSVGESFDEQPIVVLGKWMSSIGFNVGQACKKSVESMRLSREGAVDELLGAINYLAGAVVILESKPVAKQTPKPEEKSIGRVDSFDDALAQREEAAKLNGEGQARAEAEKAKAHTLSWDGKTCVRCEGSAGATTTCPGTPSYFVKKGEAPSAGVEDAHGDRVKASMERKEEKK